MREKFNSLTNTARWILIIAAAIVVAVIIWNVLAFAFALVFKIVEFAILLGILYVVFLVARSAMRNRTSS